MMMTKMSLSLLLLGLAASYTTAAGPGTVYRHMTEHIRQKSIGLCYIFCTVLIDPLMPV